MDKRVLAAACGALALLNVGLGAVPGLVSDAVVSGTLPALGGTGGSSAALYLYLLRAVGALVPVGLAAALGYRAVGGLEGPRTYRRLGKVATAGSVGGIVVGALALVAVNVATGSAWSVGLLLPVAVVSVAVDGSVLVVVGVLAGAALGPEAPLSQSESPERAGEATR